MKNKIIIINIFTIAYCINANAQSTIENVLSEISKNNKTILANTQYWEAQKLQYKTGLTPYNPAVNYDYLIGSPNTAGNQTDFTVTQSFDFPTAYIKKKQLSEQQIAQAEFQFTAKRQDVLLEAKIICMELVYRNKLQSQLSQRKQNTEKLLSDFQIKLNKGEGTILDVNKARLQLIEINNEFQQNLSSINQLNQKLTGLNGGNAIIFTDTIYPLIPNIPAFEQLESEIETTDPIRKYLEQEKLVTQKQVELSKAMSLPKLETGYHYQGILGQTFQGIHAGITIPLWENKNTVKTQQANLLFADLNLQDHRNEYYYGIKQLYEKYQNLKITFAEYQTVFASLNNTTLLNKALASGQISTIEYFMEMSYYNNAFNNYLQTEKEFYEVVTELYKYKL
ncbi:MAG: TolC family protein [Bacteroidetes bacterium]|nr:TolC family protein [Bacteroidota bacterium]